jgi:hypothetical protein
MSSPSIKIRTTNRITRPAVAIGPSSGPAMSPITRNGEDSGSSIRTGSGCWRGVAPCAGEAAGTGSENSLASWRNTVSARSIAPPLGAAECTERSFSRILY